MIEKVYYYKNHYIWYINGMYQIEGGKRFKTLKEAKKAILKEWF